ncbi:DUF6418 domain-containing protein [Aeromonas caviae]
MDKDKYFRFIRFFSFFVVIILATISMFVESDNLILEQIGLVVLIVNLFLIYKWSPVSLITGLPYFVALIPMMFGVFYAETGVYFFEIDQYTYKNGSFIKCLLLFFIFNEFLLLPVKEGRIYAPVKINHKVIEVIMLSCVFVLFLYFFKSGVPLIKGIHRSEYFSTIVPYYINFIKGRLSFFCLVWGMFYVMYRRKRYVVYFSVVVLYYILCSIKGGELIVLFYMFSLPIVLSIKKIDLPAYNVKLKRWIVGGASFFVILILFHYSSVENYNKDTSDTEKLYTRVVAAGQIWWYISDPQKIENKTRIKEFFYNFYGDDDYKKGMNQLMNEVVPAKYLRQWRSNDNNRGRSLANGFPAIGYYYFGYVGALFITVVIGYLVFVSKKLVLSFSKSGDIVSFLFLGAIIEILIRVVAQGDIYLLVEARACFIWLLFSLYLLIKFAFNYQNKYRLGI